MSLKTQPNSQVPTSETSFTISYDGIDLQAINTIRTLSIDAVQAANSGHPGAPLGFAPVIYTLWQHTLQYDPGNPRWMNRDRFVLSNGHASMMLYSTLHLAGVLRAEGNKIVNEPTISLTDIKNFRQLGSRTPGHPESHITSGIETTTGPLGQGVAASVGMAISAKWFESNYNKPDYTLFDYKVYAICGDGCLMEGISSEAASIAGHMRLNNLCWIYDANKITIEGSTDLAFTENVQKRFEAQDWDVLHVTDANDVVSLQKAFDVFKISSKKPTLIIVNSHIGFGSPRADSQAAHGEALGAENVIKTKRALGWPEDKQFYVPEGVTARFAEGMGARGKTLETKWNTTFANYKKEFPDLGKQLDLIQSGDLPDGWDQDIPKFETDAKGIATRDSGGKVMNAIAKRVPWLMGGAADLDGSTKTRLTFEGAGEFDVFGKDQSQPRGRNFHFGVREHAMGAAVNGMTQSGIRAFGSTFLIFNNYMQMTTRLAALMEIPSYFIYTHDSISLGEDGPTHQPIEQLSTLRAMPNMHVFRPADANEVVEAWKCMMKLKHAPACLILSRQALPTLDRTIYGAASGVARGGYILAGDEKETPEVILISTGSEIHLCIEAYEKLKLKGIKARVVSLTCWKMFEDQDEAYREKVLPHKVRARVCVEEASIMGWDRFAGFNGEIIGMRTFGASAPIKDLAKKFGFTVDNVLAAVTKTMNKVKDS